MAGKTGMILRGRGEEDVNTLSNTHQSEGSDYQVHFSASLEDRPWDDFVEITPGGHYLQTAGWANVKSVLGYRTARITISRDEQIMGGASILIRPIPILGAVGSPKGRCWHRNNPT